MKVYNYNIRCKVCKKGFNPKDKQNAYNNICPKCLELKKKDAAKP
jgi:rRNA maturation endonuclease Nob1